MTPPVNLPTDRDCVSLTLALLVEPGSVVELRCFYDGGTYGGTFNKPVAR